MTIDELKREALSLDPGTRASLARDLLTSLDELSEHEIEQLWFDGALRRHDEIVSGTVTAIPAEDIFSQARAARA